MPDMKWIHTLKKSTPKVIARIPTDRELQIDLDSRKELAYYKHRLQFVRGRMYSYARLRGWKFLPVVTRSRGGKGFHVTITSSQRMTVCERICLQALLGSDPNREMFNFFRYLNESRFPILFYEKAKR